MTDLFKYITGLFIGIILICIFWIKIRNRRINMCCGKMVKIPSQAEKSRRYEELIREKEDKKQKENEAKKQSSPLQEAST